MSLSARFPYLIQVFKCVHIKSNQHRTSGLPAGLRKQNGGVLVVHRMHPVSLTDIFTSSFPFGAQIVKARIASQRMREKKPLLHSSPILRWDLTRRGRWGLRRDLPSWPAEAGWGMWDAGHGGCRCGRGMLGSDCQFGLPPPTDPGPPQAVGPPQMGAGPGALLGGGAALGRSPGRQPAHPAAALGPPSSHVRPSGAPRSHRIRSQP